jgi:hypothetical protein
MEKFFNHITHILNQARMTDDEKRTIRLTLIKHMEHTPWYESFFSSFLMRQKVFTGALALILMIGTGVYAETTLPGEPLYGFKLFQERLGMALTFEPEKKALVIETRTRRRFAEARALASDNTLDGIREEIIDRELKSLNEDFEYVLETLPTPLETLALQTEYEILLRQENSFLKNTVTMLAQHDRPVSQLVLAGELRADELALETLITKEAVRGLPELDFKTLVDEKFALLEEQIPSHYLAQDTLDDESAVMSTSIPEAQSIPSNEIGEEMPEIAIATMMFEEVPLQATSQSLSEMNPPEENIQEVSKSIEPLPESQISLIDSDMLSLLISEYFLLYEAENFKEAFTLLHEIQVLLESETMSD